MDGVPNPFALVRVHHTPIGSPLTEASGAVVALTNANDPALQERFPCGFLGGRSMPARRRQGARPRALHADRGWPTLHDGQDCGCPERSLGWPLDGRFDPTIRPTGPRRGGLQQACAGYRLAAARFNRPVGTGPRPGAGAFGGTDLSSVLWRATVRRRACPGPLTPPDGPKVALCAVMTIAGKRQRIQKALLFLLFNVASVSFVTWFLSWTGGP